MGVFQRKNKDGREGETWYVDYYDPAGRRIIKAVGPKKREAEDYLGKVKSAIRENRFFDIKKESRITFNELLEAYIEKVKDQRFYQNSLSYLTEGKPGSKQKPPMREFFGKMLLSEIDYKMLETFRDERKRAPTQHGTERSNRTINIEMGFLRRIFNKAVKWDMVDRSPFDRGEDLFYKNTLKRERALTEDEVRRLLDACRGYLKPIVATAIYTGLRRRDLLSLKWKDINLERGLIQVMEMKTGKPRNIVLNRDMITLLKSLTVRGEYVFPGKNWGTLQGCEESLPDSPEKCRDKTE